MSDQACEDCGDDWAEHDPFCLHVDQEVECGCEIAPIIDQGEIYPITYPAEPSAGLRQFTERPSA